MGSFIDVVNKVRQLMPGVEHRVGAEEISALGRAVNSVVWVPSGDVFQAGRQRGSPRSLRTQVVGVQALCWGISETRKTEDDYEATDALAKRVLWAVEDALGGSWEVNSGGWEGDTTKGQKGKAYVLAFTFNFPVTRPEPRATVTAVQVETSLELASGDETGAPAP